jgi:thioredoxin-disulfide reductase
MYEVIIIGAGPAGLTAAIYASCYRLKHLVLSQDLGGQVRLATEILNYTGFTSITGKELIERMVEQTRLRGSEIKLETVSTISKEKEGFLIRTTQNSTYTTESIILATGTERRKLNVPGETEYTGRGVHYCATCEKFDYAGKICAVVGGANSAVQAVVELAQAAQKVLLVYRGTELRGDAVWLERVALNKNITVLYETRLTEIKGDGTQVTGIVVKHSQTNQTETVAVDKVFVEIGGIPGSALVATLGVNRDPGGYLIVNDRMETSLPGLFAAGDLVTHNYSIEQISTAVGLGARAAASVFAYLKQHQPAPSLWGKSQIVRQPKTTPV